MSAHQKAARARRAAKAPCLSRFDRGYEYVLAGRSRRRQRVDRKSLHKTFSNDRECALRIRQNVALLRERLSAKKTYVIPDGHDIVDRDVFLELQRQLHRGQTVRLSGAAGGPVIRRRWPIRLSQWTLISQEITANRKKGIYEHLMWVPEWKHTGDHLKALAWAVAIEQQQGRAFTLHLTQKVIDTASRNRRGFAYHIKQEISRCLRKEIQAIGLDKIPDFFFTIEAELKKDADPFDLAAWEASSRLVAHLHGGIVVPDHPDATEAIKRGLRAAGGFRKGIHTGRPLKLDKLYYAVGWAEYVVKWSLQSSLILKGSIFGATNTVRSAGRDWYHRARRERLLIYPRSGGPDLIEQAVLAA